MSEVHPMTGVIGSHERLALGRSRESPLQTAEHSILRSAPSRTSLITGVSTRASASV